MSKCDITVGKKFTINTNDFSSIQPTISITVHDIDTSKIKEAHKLMEIIADGLINLQISGDAITQAYLKKGVGLYVKSLKKDMIEEDVEKAIRGLYETKVEDRF